MTAPTQPTTDAVTPEQVAERPMYVDAIINGKRYKLHPEDVNAVMDKKDTLIRHQREEIGKLHSQLRQVQAQAEKIAGLENESNNRKAAAEMLLEIDARRDTGLRLIPSGAPKKISKVLWNSLFSYQNKLCLKLDRTGEWKDLSDQSVGYLSADTIVQPLTLSPPLSPSPAPLPEQSVPVTEQEASTLLSMIDAHSKFAAMTNQQLVDECLSHGAADYLVVTEMMSRLDPGWEDRTDLPDPDAKYQGRWTDANEEGHRYWVVERDQILFRNECQIINKPAGKSLKSAKAAIDRGDWFPCDSHGNRVEREQQGVVGPVVRLENGDVVQVTTAKVDTEQPSPDVAEGWREQWPKFYQLIDIPTAFYRFESESEAWIHRSNGEVERSKITYKDASNGERKQIPDPRSTCDEKGMEAKAETIGRNFVDDFKAGRPVISSALIATMLCDFARSELARREEGVKGLVEALEYCVAEYGSLRAKNALAALERQELSQ